MRTYRSCSRGARARRASATHTYASVSIRQHTPAYVSIRSCSRGARARRASATDTYASRQHPSAYVSIRQHTSAYVSIRQHTSAYVSIRQHTSAYVIVVVRHIPRQACMSCLFSPQHRPQRKVVRDLIRLDEVRLG
jgi:hypothetical protein